MLPVSNTPAAVAVWAKVSEFNQFTDWPTFTANGLSGSVKSGRAVAEIPRQID